MKIRNLPFKKLNPYEKSIVLDWWEECLKTGCKNSNNCHKSVDDFWEIHRDMGTNYGMFDGWKGDELGELVFNKLNKEKGGIK